MRLLGEARKGGDNRMRINLAMVMLLTSGAAQAEHMFEGRDIAAGQALYQQNCAACHGSNLEGQENWQTRNSDGTLPAPPHDVSGHTWHHDSQMLFQYTRLGGARALADMGVTDFQSGMPAFGDDLSDDDIWNILAFIQSTWPEEVRQIQASRSSGHD